MKLYGNCGVKATVIEQARTTMKTIEPGLLTRLWSVAHEISERRF